MIPAALFAVLAVSRIGAVHTIVFGGFSGAALAQRVDDSKSKVIMTASCSVEGSKGPIPYRKFVREALTISNYRPDRVIIWQRGQSLWQPIETRLGERHWQALVESGKRSRVKAENVPVSSNAGAYILYTSGKDNKPSC
jgi:propionyl-CoA synthetase